MTAPVLAAGAVVTAAALLALSWLGLRRLGESRRVERRSCRRCTKTWVGTETRCCCGGDTDIGAIPVIRIPEQRAAPDVERSARRATSGGPGG